MTLTPLQRYQQDLQLSDFQEDSSQYLAVRKLEDLHHRLTARQAPAVRSPLGWLWQGLAGRLNTTGEPEQGLYFWGGVGRGKTYLMDIFFDSLPFEKKMRVHFHRFMRRVHRELTALKYQKNPLQLVAKRLAEETTIICFDEFYVSDITDAMILAALFQGLFERKVCLVATSNIEPNDLYKDGLQRARFLPAIDSINRYTEVVNVDGGTDYRLRTLDQVNLYHSPLDEKAETSLKGTFERLVPDVCTIEEHVYLEIEGRSIFSRFHAEDVVWFDFSVLCDGPRSQNDYIEIALEYHSVLLSNVLEMTEQHESQARRFVNMVDEFYDRSVKLIISAARPIDKLYSGKRLVFEFQRTISRLLEMQSREYLSRPHKP
ncbi:MAG: cell division protein ZapE [Cellvibrionaceae bacterium]|jgi:cell division protein ZapE